MSEASPSEPKSTVPSEAKGQAAGGSITVITPEDGEGLKPSTLDEAVHLLSQEEKHGRTAVLRTLAIWVRDWAAKGEQITTLREEVASLKAERRERGRYRVLITSAQAAGPVIAAVGLELLREESVGIGIALTLTGVVIFVAALWANRGDPA